MFSPALLDGELLESFGRRKCRIEQTIKAVPSRCECPAEEERIQLNWKGFAIVYMVLAVVVPLRFASDPLVTLEAKLRKAVLFCKFRRITFINMVPSLGDVDAIETEEKKRLAKS
jgi:hypothetical protein